MSPFIYVLGRAESIVYDKAPDCRASTFNFGCICANVAKRMIQDAARIHQDR